LNQVANCGRGGHFAKRAYCYSTVCVLFCEVVRHKYLTEDEIMDVLRIMNVGFIMDSYEKFNVFNHGRIGEYLNKQHIFNQNMLFELLLKYMLAKKVGTCR
jgi:hypothetical protein